MSSNTEKVVKIVSILIIGGLFIGFMMWLRNSMKTNCGVDEEFSKDLNKCIPKCKGDTVYDDTKGKCVTKCNSTQIECNGNCYDNNHQCIQDGNGGEVPCGIKDTGLCGTDCITSDTVCVNVNGVQILINNNDQRLCNKNTTPIVCEEGKLCDTLNGDTCITCASGNVCGTNCCDPGIACDSTGYKCGDSCPKDKMCGKGLCCKDTEKCNGDKCISCGEISISNCGFCGDVAYDTTKSFCDGTTTCSILQTFKDANGKNRCCDGTVADGKCCSKESHEIEHEGKCMIQCRDDKDQPIDLYCDPSKNQVCATNDNLNGLNKYYCQTVDCRWSQIDYFPSDFQKDKDSKITYPICSYQDGGNEKYYMTKQPGLPLSRIVHTSEFSDNKCQSTDCTSRIAEYGLVTDRFGKQNPDDKNEKNQCEGIFDCNKILKDNLESCPFIKDDNKPDIGRCCVSGTNFTGQVCEKGKVCINDKCFIPSFKCSMDGKCVEYGLDSLDDPNVSGKFNESSCSNECVAAPSPITTNAPCGWYDDGDGPHGESCSGGYGHDAEQAKRICTNFQNGRWDKNISGGPPPAQSILDRTKYSWTCGPNYNGSGDVIDNGNHDPQCTCIPTIVGKTCDIFQDADRKRLPVDNICYKA